MEAPQMEGYMNTVYKGPAGETTQWDDIQRKLGNFKAKEAAWKPDRFAPEQDEVKDKEWVDKKDEEELSDLEDEFQDDRYLEEYRQRRIQELQNAAKRPRFGTVEDIRGSEFVQKVTNAGPEIHVVVHLYKDGHEASALVGQSVSELAAKYPGTKFLRIVSTDCIPNYPDSNLPTLLLYHEGRCLQHLVGLAAMGGPRTTPEQVAMTVNKYGNFCPVGGEDGSGEEAGQQAQIRSLVQRMLQEREQNGDKEESSDFDD